MTKTTIANDRMNRPLDSVDPQIADLLRDEARRQATGLELIPSENLVSQAVLEAMGSIFTNKYAEAIRASATTAVANMPTRSSNWLSIAPRNFSGRSTPTCKRIPAHPLTWLFTCPPCKKTTWFLG